MRRIQLSDFPIIYENGKEKSVIIDIKEFREMKKLINSLIEYDYFDDLLEELDLAPIIREREERYQKDKKTIPYEEVFGEKL